MRIGLNTFLKHLDVIEVSVAEWNISVREEGEERSSDNEEYSSQGHTGTREENQNPPWFIQTLDSV